jgi:hypothetical protein
LSRSALAPLISHVAAQSLDRLKRAMQQLAEA